MKSLQLTDLKKHETLPNSYQVSLAYKGRKVDLILDNYAYSPTALGNGQQPTH